MNEMDPDASAKAFVEQYYSTFDTNRNNLPCSLSRLRRSWAPPTSSPNSLPFPSNSASTPSPPSIPSPPLSTPPCSSSSAATSSSPANNTPLSLAKCSI
ncbi:hypothetical protein D0Y65_047121 [Glycine soja]|uniref:NTF2 domain-containing protein n=1 Tax=Glycine soja TaxID=3848 RepID=A0A445FMB9_GLYSO|nr:hypothetical protein D0Y65_047121 [Glycine soja]